MLISRRITDDDVEECLELNASAIGQEAIGRARALRAWRILIKSIASKSVVIALPELMAGRGIIGFGASVFVSRKFADDEIREPRPGLNGRIVSSIDAGRPVVLTDAEIRCCNTCGGLCQVVLYSAWRRGALTPQQTTEVEMTLAKNYVELHEGYQLERLLFEATNAIDIDRARSSKLWRFVSDYGDFYAKNAGHGCNRDRALALSEREDALARIGTAAAFVFHYNRPVLRFGDRNQELLAAAVEGLTDEELAQKLHLSMQTVKKRWASVFNHVSKVMPCLLHETEGSLDRPTRGRQKRHHLLAYLRHHPEELRPMIQ